jgi:YegS/Rv2252/BmrU family lipid kinase
MTPSLLLLVNPVSGKGNNESISDEIKVFLEDKKWLVTKITSHFKNQFIKLLQETNLASYTHIGVVGGDGTMHEVVNGLLNRSEKTDIPIILFPCGTGNSFNFDLGCFTVKNALERLVAGNHRKIDLMKVQCDQECFFAFNETGFGIVNDINALAEKLRWFGSIRYSLASILYIFKNPHYVSKVFVDNVEYSGDMCFVLTCNTIHTGKAMKIAPLASISDGFLDVLVVKRLKVTQLLALFPKIFSGTHVPSPFIEYIHAKSIKIYPEQPQFGNIDGEVKGFSPFEIEIIPLALNIIC